MSCLGGGAWTKLAAIRVVKMSSGLDSPSQKRITTVCQAESLRLANRNILPLQDAEPALTNEVVYHFANRH